MPTSIPIDAETEALLERLAQTQQRPKADILREALHRFAQNRRVENAKVPMEWSPI